MPIFSKLNAKSVSSLAFSKTPSKKLGTFDENIKIPPSSATTRSGVYNESEPIYMFGKYNGAPWVAKKPLPSKQISTILNRFKFKQNYNI